MAEAAAAELKSSLEALVKDVEKRQVRPAQKRSFLCSAKCCDSASDEGDLKSCLQNCQQPVAAMEQVVTSKLSQFQERLQRGMIRCQDTAQEKLPAQPSEKHIAAAQADMERCIKDVAKQYLSQVPKLKSDIEASVKNL